MLARGGKMTAACLPPKRTCMALVEHLIARIPDVALRQGHRARGRRSQEAPDLGPGLRALHPRDHATARAQRAHSGRCRGLGTPGHERPRPFRARSRAPSWSSSWKPRAIRRLMTPEPSASPAPRSSSRKPFGEPVFPALISLGSIRHGPAGRPSQAVIGPSQDLGRGQEPPCVPDARPGLLADPAISADDP